jgi:hypothetical protein
MLPKFSDALCVLTLENNHVLGVSWNKAIDVEEMSHEIARNEKEISLDTGQLVGSKYCDAIDLQWSGNFTNDTWKGTYCRKRHRRPR